jgi:hypothetical protein
VQTGFFFKGKRTLVFFNGARSQKLPFRWRYYPFQLWDQAGLSRFHYSQHSCKVSWPQLSSMSPSHERLISSCWKVESNCIEHALVPGSTDRLGALRRLDRPLNPLFLQATLLSPACALLSLTTAASFLLQTRDARALTNLPLRRHRAGSRAI